MTGIDEFYEELARQKHGSRRIVENENDELREVLEDLKQIVRDLKCTVDEAIGVYQLYLDATPMKVKNDAGN